MDGSKSHISFLPKYIRLILLYPYTNLSQVMWRSFFCAMIAAITLKVLDPFGTGKLVLFQVTYDKVRRWHRCELWDIDHPQDWHGYELFPFLLLGVFGVSLHMATTSYSVL